MQADLSGEVPVGAVVVELSTLKIVGRGKNEIISRKDPTAHAELLAIREACAHFQSERMLPSVLVSTLEPCTLCTGAILFARVAEVQYFTPVLSGAGIVRLLDQFGTSYNHRPLLTHIESHQEKARQILISFFERKRARIPEV